MTKLMKKFLSCERRKDNPSFGGVYDIFGSNDDEMKVKDFNAGSGSGDAAQKVCPEQSAFFVVLCIARQNHYVGFFVAKLSSKFKSLLMHPRWSRLVANHFPGHRE